MAAGIDRSAIAPPSSESFLSRRNHRGAVAIAAWCAAIDFNEEWRLFYLVWQRYVAYVGSAAYVASAAYVSSAAYVGSAAYVSSAPYVAADDTSYLGITVPCF